jgi:TonB family protein
VKKMSKRNNISDCSESYSEEYLLKYINDELSDEQNIILESHLKECQVCSDVIDGLFMMENPEEIAAISSELNILIEKKSNAKRRILGMKYLTFRAVAAVFLLLLISGSFLLINNLIDENSIQTVNDISKIGNASKDTNIVCDKVIEDGAKMVADLSETEETENIVTKSTNNQQHNSITETEQVFFEFDTDQPSNDEVLDDLENQKSGEEIRVVSELSVQENITFATGNTSSNGSGIVVGSNDRYAPGTEEELNEPEEAKEISTVSKESKDVFWKNNRRENKKESVTKEKSDETRFFADAPVTTTNIATQIVVLNDLVMQDADSVFQSFSEVVLEEDEGIVTEELVVVNDEKLEDKSELDSNDKEEALAFITVEEKPQYPGGDSALMNYLAKSFEYPDATVERSIQSQIYVQFVIDKTGKVIDVEVLSGVDLDLDNEAVRVVKNMPNWIPGKQNGKPVSVIFVIPLNIDFK